MGAALPAVRAVASRAGLLIGRQRRDRTRRDHGGGARGVHDAQQTGRAVARQERLGLGPVDGEALADDLGAIVFP